MAYPWHPTETQARLQPERSAIETGQGGGTRPSHHLEPDYVTRLIAGEIGGVGCLLNDRGADPAELIEAAKRVSGGGSTIDK